MKRTMPGDPTPIPMPLWAPVPAPQGVQAPTPRARLPDGTLESLADPPMVYHHRTLEFALGELVSQQETAMQGGGHDPDLQAAIDLILALDTHDQTPYANTGTFDAAVNMLFALQQGRLLCRLAALNKHVHFRFDVGLDQALAWALERIGSHWPQDVAVTLSLNADLVPSSLWGLRDFVQCPRRLSLCIVAGSVVAMNAADAIGHVVGHRALEELSLTINGYAWRILQSLCGVRARAIEIVANHVTYVDPRPLLPPGMQAAVAPTEVAPAPVRISAFSPDWNAQYEQAVIDLVCQSGARVLKMPASHLDVPLCVRLLSIRSDWDTVQFSVLESAALERCLDAGLYTIRRLELKDLSRPNRFYIADLLCWVAMFGVNTLVIDGPVSLHQLANGLASHLLTSTHVFEWIEAFLLMDDDDMDDANFEEAVFGRTCRQRSEGAGVECRHRTHPGAGPAR